MNSPIRETDRNPVLADLRVWYNDFLRMQGQAPTWSHVYNVLSYRMHRNFYERSEVHPLDRYRAVLVIGRLADLGDIDKAEAERNAIVAEGLDKAIAIIDRVYGPDLKPKNGDQIHGLDPWEQGYVAALRHIKSEILAAKEATVADD
jgi:hypothetical protein